MKPYRNLSGASGVTAYEIDENYIDVEFVDGHAYRYDYAVTGRSNVEKLKSLALSGRGLSTYISRVVRNAYAARLY